jgi:hypothetical protein
VLIACKNASTGKVWFVRDNAPEYQKHELLIAQKIFTFCCACKESGANMLVRFGEGENQKIWLNPGFLFLGNILRQIGNPSFQEYTNAYNAARQGSALSHQAVPPALPVLPREIQIPAVVKENPSVSVGIPKNDSVQTQVLVSPSAPKETVSDDEFPFGVVLPKVANDAMVFVLGNVLRLLEQRFSWKHHVLPYELVAELVRPIAPEEFQRDKAFWGWFRGFLSSAKRKILTEVLLAKKEKSMIE